MAVVLLGPGLETKATAAGWGLGDGGVPAMRSERVPTEARSIIRRSAGTSNLSTTAQRRKTASLVRRIAQRLQQKTEDGTREVAPRQREDEKTRGCTPAVGGTCCRGSGPRGRWTPTYAGGDVDARPSWEALPMTKRGRHSRAVASGSTFQRSGGGAAGRARRFQVRHAIKVYRITVRGT